MAEDLIIAGATRELKYQSLLPQLEALLGDERDQTANLANLAAALRQTFEFFWVGFYRVVGEELVLGPFQGPIACTRIGRGQGVCGYCWQQKKTILVPNVEEFPGHIACSSASRSEMVIPFFDDRGEVALVLDVDSDRLADFDAVDQHYLEALARKVERRVC